MDTRKKNTIDMCHGPLFSKIVLFAIPVILSGILQLLFNAADMVVLGHYAPPTAMAAVGASGVIVGLIINLFMGLSIGANVVVANCIGAGDRKNTSPAVHTTVALAMIGGTALGIIGLLITKFMLQLAATPAEVMPKAALYLRIYCCGIPAIVIFNFGAAILRAMGDTRNPLIYLTLSGVVNVLLNLFFILVFGMDVGGVALATTISQIISALMILRKLLSLRDACRLKWSNLHIDWTLLRKTLWIGLPAGIQSTIFTISNFTIQSSINSLGAAAMAGSAATQTIEGMIYAASYSLHQTVISFIGQHVGAQKYHRIKKIIFYCMICAAGVNLFLSYTSILFGEQLLAIVNPNQEVIEWGLQRMKVCFSTYALCAVMDVITGSLRGLGHSILPAIVTLLGTCGLRILWVIYVFPHYRTFTSLLLCYPLSWLFAICVIGVLLYVICKKPFAQNRYGTLSPSR